MHWRLFALILALCSGVRAQSVSEQYLLLAANQDRAREGVGQLRVDLALTAAALSHAREMARHGMISHKFPGEADLAERVGQAGVHFSLVTENVAEAPDASELHALWMHSPGHRRNLMDGEVSAIGIAVVADHGQFYAVEDFARTVEDLPLAAQEERVAALVAAQGIVAKPASEDARRTCGFTSGYAGSHRPWFIMRYTTSDLAVLPPELFARLGTGKYRTAEVGACPASRPGAFTSYNLAVLLFP